MTLASFALACLLLAPASRTSSGLHQAASSPAEQRRTAIGAALGLTVTGLVLRQQFTRYFGAQASVYSTFGSSHGIHIVGLGPQLMLLNWKEARVFASLPIRWRRDLTVTERASNIGPDPRRRIVDELRVGLGVGAEFFILPKVALFWELPVVVRRHWVQRPNKHLLEPSQFWQSLVAPSIGLYVYFR